MPDGEPAPSTGRRVRAARGWLRELPVLVVVAFVLALVVKAFLVQAFFIPSGSMERTLHGCPGCTGDRVLVNKLVYRVRDVRSVTGVLTARRAVGAALPQPDRLMPRAPGGPRRHNAAPAPSTA